MSDKQSKHTKNGLIINKTYINGFLVSVIIGKGVDGETTFLMIENTNLYPDADSRSEEINRKFILPFNHTEDLMDMVNLITKSIEERNLTLIKNEKI